MTHLEEALQRALVDHLRGRALRLAHGDDCEARSQFMFSSALL
jgi:hypothetical protein